MIPNERIHAILRGLFTDAKTIDELRWLHTVFTKVIDENMTDLQRWSLSVTFCDREIALRGVTVNDPPVRAYPRFSLSEDPPLRWSRGVSRDAHGAPDGECCEGTAPEDLDGQRGRQDHKGIG